MGRIAMEEVGRLRSRLNITDQDGPNEPVRIEIPKGGLSARVHLRRTRYETSIAITF